MKLPLSWIREYVDVELEPAELAHRLTMAGLEVEDVEDPAAKLGRFTVAKVVEAVQHPNADRLRVCQVDTVDGRKEIVCGAPNARPGLTTIYAPIGATIPANGMVLVEKPVRGVVSNGMLCSAAELELGVDSDGILELSDELAVGTPAAQVFAAEPVIDFEVTPNRPDWLGVMGIARDLAAAGLGKRVDRDPKRAKGRFDCPVEIRLPAPEACPVFAGRLIRGVKNGPSPKWLQERLKAIGINPKSMLIDVTNYVSYDRCRPLHVYDAGLLTGGYVEARLGRPGDRFAALDGETYEPTPEMCVIADASGAIGFGGVMGGQSTAVSEATVDVFIESAWFDPLRTAQTARATGINSDAAYRFARGVDPESCADGLELATALILEVCGGEPSELVVAGEAPLRPDSFEFDPAYVHRLSGLDVPRKRTLDILGALGFDVSSAGIGNVTVHPPSWRRDIEGKADLVEEVARIEGYGSLPSTPLPDAAIAARGVLTPLQSRARTARRAMAAAGWQEAVTWSFVERSKARLFGGGDERLVVDNPIASDLDCMRPTALPGLVEAVQRNADRGFSGARLYEVGPFYLGDGPTEQREAVAGVMAPSKVRRWDGQADDPLFAVKGDVMALLADLGAPMGSVQLVQGRARDIWHPGRSASIQLGPKTTLAEFGELHPRVLKALDADGPLYGFEVVLDNIPAPKAKATKSRPALALSPLMPLTRDFAFLVDEDRAAGDLVRAMASADKALIAEARVFDVYRGQGVPAGSKSIAVEVVIQPREATLTDAEIEALSARIVAAAEKAVGAKLRA